MDETICRISVGLRVLVAWGQAAIALVLCCAGSLLAAPTLSVPLQRPNNIFAVGQVVRFDVKCRDFPAGETLLAAEVVDLFGRTVWSSRPVVHPQNAAESVVLGIGKLPPGYYELTLRGPGEMQTKSSFGVAQFVDRTAEQARAGGYRFGLKMGGADKDFDSLSAMATAARLGLQWTRVVDHDKKLNDVAQLPVNLVVKVEGMPSDAYDAARYGPMDQYKRRKQGWQKTSLPLEVPYKRWLREQIEQVPANENIFEIWNEPWGKMPADDFAKLAQWSKDVIRELRPGAKVGPNLGHLDYDADFIAAGGMKDMDILVLHPYGHAERSGIREDLRRVKAYYREHTGREIDLYATEYGSPTPPAGPYSDVTEPIQAQRAVRTSLALYAEDVKAFMPHVLGQLEKDPKNKEQWYGYFRRNGEPKPNLLAMATCAQLIDGSRYVGDLFVKPEVGAMLFEKSGNYTLVLWTNDQNIPVDLKIGEPSVTKVNMVGTPETLRADGGRVSLALTGEPIYLVGVNPDLAKQASTELRPDRWVVGRFVRGTRVAHRMATPPTIDGRIDESEWEGQTQIALANKKVAPADASATGFVSWDSKHLYVAAKVTDDHPSPNTFKPAECYAGDSLELMVCSQPKFQIPDFLNTHDVHMMFAPTCATGRPVAGAVEVANIKLSDIPGLQIAWGHSDHGWSVEMAIPLKYFKDFAGQVGHQACLEMRVNDLDPGHPRFKIEPADGGLPSHVDATKWSYLELAE
ncbi:MAG: sugar-binding protein [Tepidisphaeraceae bacterium]